APAIPSPAVLASTPMGLGSPPAGALPISTMRVFRETSSLPALPARRRSAVVSPDLSLARVLSSLLCRRAPRVYCRESPPLAPGLSVIHQPISRRTQTGLRSPTPLLPAARSPSPRYHRKRRSVHGFEH